MRDYPLNFHKLAPKAAEAAHCAGEQGLYWEMDDLLFKNSKQLMPEKLPEYAVAVGAELEPFQACLDSGRHAEAVKTGTADAGKAGITGTPSFILGKMDPGGDKVNFTVRIKGAKGYESFKAEIDKLLAAK
jgi:protein-disulfide isomerase